MGDQPVSARLMMSTCRTMTWTACSFCNVGVYFILPCSWRTNCWNMFWCHVKRMPSMSLFLIPRWSGNEKQQEVGTNCDWQFVVRHTWRQCGAVIKSIWWIYSVFSWNCSQHLGWLVGWLMFFYHRWAHVSTWAILATKQPTTEPSNFLGFCSETAASRLPCESGAVGCHTSFLCAVASHGIENVKTFSTCFPFVRCLCP